MYVYVCMCVCVCVCVLSDGSGWAIGNSDFAEHETARNSVPRLIICLFY